MEELKPCSKCGKIPELIWSDDVLFKYDTRSYAYRCPGCSVSTNFSDLIEEANKNWNERMDNNKID